MTPDRIKAFLDDLARISLRHGVRIERPSPRTTVKLSSTESDFARYDAVACTNGERGESLSLLPLTIHMKRYRDGVTFMGKFTASSIDITQLSNHERLAIMAAENLFNYGNPAPEMDGVLWAVEGLNDDIAHGRCARVKAEAMDAIIKAVEEMRGEIIAAMSNHERLEFEGGQS